jgi:hypothetical protein
MHLPPRAALLISSREGTYDESTDCTGDLLRDAGGGAVDIQIWQHGAAPLTAVFHRRQRRWRHQHLGDHAAVRQWNVNVALGLAVGLSFMLSQLSLAQWSGVAIISAGIFILV